MYPSRGRKPGLVTISALTCPHKELDEASPNHGLVTDSSLHIVHLALPAPWRAPILKKSFYTKTQHSDTSSFFRFVVFSSIYGRNMLVLYSIFYYAI